MGTYGKIFISYRREDAPGDARGICDRLGHSFGAANVFMDVDRILAGQRFDRELDKALAKCDVLIAVIGSRWMELLSDYAQHGKRDYVRDEIAAALQRDIIVIPVMIGREANMPPLPLAENLPENIRDLVLYQKHNIAHETFGRDAADLVAALKTVLGARRGPRPWRAIAATGVVGLVLAVAAIGYWMDILPGIKPPAQDHVVASSTTAAIMNPDVASQKAEAEARKEEEARKKAEADVKAADDAAKTRAAEEQAAKRAADAEAARQKAEAEAKAADDAARKKADADVKAADEAARKRRPRTLPLSRRRTLRRHGKPTSKRNSALLRIAIALPPHRLITTDQVAWQVFRTPRLNSRRRQPVMMRCAVTRRRSVLCIRPDVRPSRARIMQRQRIFSAARAKKATLERSPASAFCITTASVSRRIMPKLAISTRRRRSAAIPLA